MARLGAELRPEAVAASLPHGDAQPGARVEAGSSEGVTGREKAGGRKGKAGFGFWILSFGEFGQILLIWI